MEINKEELDRIIISSNAQMQKIIDWFQENQDYIVKITNDQMEFPMHDGIICHEEEGIQCEFHDLENGLTEFILYLYHNQLNEYFKCFSFKVDLTKTEPVVNYEEEFIDLKVYAEDPSAKRKMKMVAFMDNTFGKQIYKMECIMAFMNFYDEIVEVDHSQDKPRTKRVARAMKSKYKSPISLVRKTYIIKDFDEKKIRIPGQPRKWTAPDREVGVRGHYRHLKSGKVVWVKECVKYKGKSRQKPKTYKY